MALEWKGAPGNVIASGSKGLYTIQTVGSEFILQGIGNNDQPMWALGILGTAFGELNEAKQYASEFDGTA